MKNLPFCFDCGGRLVYDRDTKTYSCELCGSTYTSQDLLIEREKRFNSKFEIEKKKRRREEYLEWWLSSKQ